MKDKILENLILKEQVKSVKTFCELNIKTIPDSGIVELSKLILAMLETIEVAYKKDSE